MSIGVVLLIVVGVLLAGGGALNWWLGRRARASTPADPMRRAGDGTDPGRTGLPPDEVRTSFWLRRGGGPPPT